jgi:hypothetical protein
MTRLAASQCAGPGLSRNWESVEMVNVMSGVEGLNIQYLKTQIKGQSTSNEHYSNMPNTPSICLQQPSI